MTDVKRLDVGPDSWQLNNVGASEESMKTFMYEHLSGILQPFADRLDFLDTAVDKLNAEVPTTASKIDNNNKAAEEIRSDLHKVKLHVDSILACQDAKHRELSSGKVAMKKEMQKMSGEISGLASRQNQLQSDIVDLQRGLKDSDSMANLFKAALAEVEQKINAFDFTAVDRLQMDLDRLERAHASTLQMARDTAYQREKDHVELLQLMDNVKYQEHKQEGKSNAVNAAVSNLQKRIDQTNHILNGVNHDRIARTYDDVDALQRQMKQMTKAQAGLETRQLERAGESDNLKASITDLKTAVGVTDEGFKTELGLNHAVRQLRDDMHRHATEMREIGRRCEKQADEVQNGTRRITELEKSEPHLHVAHRELENQMIGRMRNLENALMKQSAKQDEYQRTKAAHADAVTARELDFGKSDTMAVNEQLAETSQMKKTLRKMGDTVQNNETRLHGLENKIAALHDTVVSLRGGVDLTHEYWKGLTKGVQKTHKSVLSEDEIFAKNPLNKQLPSLGSQ